MQNYGTVGFSAILPAEFEREMRKVSAIPDVKERHMAADKLMAETLNSLGYEAGTKVFESMELWYAE